MAQELEPLNLKITGNANGLSAALGKAQTDISRFKGGITDASSRLSGFGLGGLSGGFVAGAASIAAVTAAFVALKATVELTTAGIRGMLSEFQKIDKIQEAAEKLNLTFTELRGLTFAFDENGGLSSEDTNKAIQKLQLNLAEAKQGTGEAFDTLKRLGLDATQLLSVGTVAAIQKIAFAVSQVKDPAEQMKITFDLLGKSGVGVVAGFRDGGEKLKESFEFAQRWLGVSQEQAQLIASLNDDMGRVGVIVEGIKQAFAAELAPLAKVIVEEITAFAEEFGGVQNLAREFADALTYAVGFSKDLFEVWTALGQVIGNLALGNFKEAMNAINDAVAFDSGDKLLARVRQIRQEMSSTPLKPNIDTSDIENSLAEIERWTTKAKSLQESLLTPNEKYKGKIEELSQAVIKGGLDFETFGRGVRAAYEELEKLNKQSSEFSRPQTALRGSKEAQAILDQREFDARANNQIAKEIERLKLTAQEKRGQPIDELKTALSAKLDVVSTKLEGVIAAINNNRITVRQANV
ncbi:MAG: hypothetical protein U0930_03475 [Pirellulales bacterium]